MVVAAVKKQLQVETSTLISSEPGQRLLKSAASSASRSFGSKSSQNSSTALLAQAQRHEAHVQQCFYRICTPVTSFKVRDPDPNAVDNGNVLGLRFEVMSRGQFFNPYYVMLNRPYHNSTHLRVHRHTMPPSIPLAGIAARTLPPPKPDIDNPPQQDLDRFARMLRREITRYHNRMGVAADLRRDASMQQKDQEDPRPNDIVEVGIADAEAKQLRLTWADERSGRLVMDDDGKVVKLVIYGEQGRDWETAKELFGHQERVEDVVKHLQEYAAG